MSRAIGIFGGTFDPVHLGHRFIAEQALKAVSLDKLIIVPAKVPPHKTASGLTSEQQRLDMCRLAFDPLEKTEVSDFELTQEGKSYSYNTVRHFKELYPEDTVYFIMGSDQLLTFEKWYRYQDILAMSNIIALSRDDSVAADEMKAYAERLCGDADKVTVLEVEPFELSSTEIRDRLKAGQPCDKLLDPKVLDYISENKLYGFEANGSMCEKTKKKYIEYKNYIKDHLSKKRAQHSINVAEAALKLAKLYNADEDKAYLAGLLHDVCKELPPEEQLEYVMRSNFSDVSEPEKRSTPLFHAVAGSVFVQEHFGIDDPEIIRAIRYHTVACGNMDKLSQIIYIADLISEDRDYKDVKKMRKYAEQGLEKAMLEALKFSIADSVGKENTIPFLTFESYHYFLNIKKEAKYGSN